MGVEATEAERSEAVATAAGSREAAAETVVGRRALLAGSSEAEESAAVATEGENLEAEATVKEVVDSAADQAGADLAAGTWKCTDCRRTAWCSVHT
jgi:hypothetical protein